MRTGAHLHRTHSWPSPSGRLVWPRGLLKKPYAAKQPKWGETDKPHHTDFSTPLRKLGLMWIKPTAVIFFCFYLATCVVLTNRIHPFSSPLPANLCGSRCNPVISGAQGSSDGGTRKSFDNHLLNAFADICLANRSTATLGCFIRTRHVY